MPDTKAKNPQAPAWSEEIKTVRLTICLGDGPNSYSFLASDELIDFIAQVESAAYQRGVADTEARLRGENPY